MAAHAKLQWCTSRQNPGRTPLNDDDTWSRHAAIQTLYLRRASAPLTNDLNDLNSSHLHM